MIMNEFFLICQKDCNPGIQYNTIQYNTIQYKDSFKFLKLHIFNIFNNIKKYINFLSKEIIKDMITI